MYGQTYKLFLPLTLNPIPWCFYLFLFLFYFFIIIFLINVKKNALEAITYIIIHISGFERFTDPTAEDRCAWHVLLGNGLQLVEHVRFTVFTEK